MRGMHLDNSLETSQNSSERQTEHRPPNGEFHIWAGNRQLALAGVKSDLRAWKFDGKDAASYHGWKNALELQVSGLNLTPGEWLELLGLRTSGPILDIVKRAIKMGIADPQTALDFVWGELSERFKRHPPAAKEVLAELHTFKQIRADDSEALWKFALVCRQAKMLSATEQGRALAVLDFADVQRNVTKSLDGRLRERWRRKYAELMEENPIDDVPFSVFADWISQVARETTPGY